MSWPLNTIVVIALVGASFRIGYDRGLARAPEFQTIDDKFVIQTLEASLRNQRNSAHSPEECLSIVTDGNVDLHSFCSDYLRAEDLKMYDGMSDERDPYE